MTQPLPWDAPLARVTLRKRVRDTSRAVYAERRQRDKAKSEAGQETREGQVLRLLAAFCNYKQAWPTALELLHFGLSRGERLFDANSVRPRITAMVSQGLVESAGKRTCAVSGKLVTVWRVVQR